MKKKIIKFGLPLVVLAFLFWGYKSQFTKIGLVNFRDTQMAEIVMANDNYFIEPIQIDPKTNDFSELVDYPVIYLFHISVLTTEQKENIKKAMDKGSKVHVLMATSKENNFSNITANDLAYIKSCFENNAVANTQRWLNYSRKVFDKKSLFTTNITPAKIFPKDVFYRIGTDDYFEKLEDYWLYYRKKGLYKEERPVIVLISTNNGPQSQFRSYMDKIILELESRNFNVLCLSGFTHKLDNLKKIAPQMVISFPHGRLSKADASVDWLKENNILYLTPQLVYQSEEDWKNDQQGISGGIMGQNIVVPELDGAIYPYAIAAQYITKNGFHTFKPIPGRVNRFCENVERWLSLKEKSNADKKLAIYYYKGPGKNAMVAGGLEVGESMYNLLKKLRSEGYTVTDLTDNYDDFIKKVYLEGPLLGNYAKGTFKTFLEEGNPELINTATYESWCKSELDPESYKNVVKTYGIAPGKYLSTDKGEEKFLAIPRVLFGNIALVPVLPSALGENEFKMVHGVKKAPPHAYIASYLWAKKGFKADVIAHFGSHGSVEFSPWKQLVLSLKDWPEALIAPVPHLYLYSVDNIGEAMMAKRRSYATMVSHLTPPYSDSQLYGELKDIEEIVHKYQGMQDGDLKKVYKKRIRAVIDSLHLDKDLDFTAQQIEELDEETVGYIHHYLHEVETEKITMGLHSLGVDQTIEERNETVRMMAIDPIASSLRELKTYRKKIRGGKTVGHAPNFERKASYIIDEVLKNGKNPLDLFGNANTVLLAKLQKKYGELEKTPISDYYGGSYARKKKRAPKEALVYDIKTHKMVPKSSLQPKEVNRKVLDQHTIKSAEKKEKQILASLLQFKSSLLDITNYKTGISISPSLELNAFINGMQGGYVAPSSGGDPVSNPLAVPTGKNLYSINEQITPTEEAFEIGQILAEKILQKHIAKHGDYPKKIAYSLWGGEFIRNQGMNIGQIFYMLGVEPVRNSYGRVHDVRLIPMETLKRPRIDVLVQTSGQFRDIAASRIDLINKAISIAAEADDGNAYKNYVKDGVLLAEKELKEKGFSPEEAQRYAKVRVFGGLNGNYGTGIMGLVERGDKWETEQEIAATYTANMGAVYGSDNWAVYKEGLFETMMNNTEIVIHPRSSNETGPISLDHVYEFMGGLTISIRVNTGKDPDGYFNDYRNRYNADVQSLKEAIWTETRTNLFNPKFIKAQMQEGESAAEGFAENFRDTYGWNVMKPSAIDKEIWEGYYDIYVMDKKNLGTVDFFKKTNPYALQEMTAVMLETVRKGYWKPSETVKKNIAELHAELIKYFDAGCSGFVCDNTKLKEMISSLLSDDLNTTYKEAIENVRTATSEKQENKEGMLLEKEVLQKEIITTLLKDNIEAILILVLLIGGAIIWGIVKRRREEE